MKTHFHDDAMAYTGTALANHWIYKNFGMVGDAVVAFEGPCDVDLNHMVDIEDVLNNDIIHSQSMLHFVIEIFGISLREGVLVQRLFTSILQDRINGLQDGLITRRHGDDLFVNNTKKLSVSICTISPTSILIHTGLNIDSEGTPVETAGLKSELKMDDIQGFAVSAMRNLAEEWQDTQRCTCKVRAV